MRIKNILKFLFSTRFYLIGKKQNPDRAMKKKFLVLKGFNGYDFISQKENWSAFFRVPYYCHGDVPPQIVFEELLASIRKYPEEKINWFLSGYTSEKTDILVLSPREGIKYQVMFFRGELIDEVVNDQVFVCSHFKQVPHLRIHLLERKYRLVDLYYLFQQLHMLQAICSTYWKRNASFEQGKTLFGMEDVISIYPGTISGIKEILFYKKQLVSKSAYEMRIHSDIPFNELTWKHIYFKERKD